MESVGAPLSTLSASGGRTPTRRRLGLPGGPAQALPSTRPSPPFSPAGGSGRGNGRRSPQNQEGFCHTIIARPDDDTSPSDLGDSMGRIELRSPAIQAGFRLRSAITSSGHRLPGPIGLSDLRLIYEASMSLSRQAFLLCADPANLLSRGPDHRLGDDKRNLGLTAVTGDG